MAAVPRIIPVAQFYQLASDGWRSKHCDNGHKVLNFMINLPGGGTVFLGLEVWTGDRSLDTAAVIQVTEKWFAKVLCACHSLAA